MLFDFWYPAIRSSRVRRETLHAVTLLDIQLVIGRDTEKRPFALRDRCPHRGMPLSFGRFEGKALQCCYHGWKFDPADGRCCDIPSLAAGSKLKMERIFVTAFLCTEHDGYIWVYMPSDPAAYREPQITAPRLPVFGEHYTVTHLEADLPCSVDDGIIGLMDPAHGPFVHQSWWWRSRRSIHEKEKRFEPIPNGFRMTAHTPSANSAPYRLLRWYADSSAITTTIDFVLPNIRLEQIRAGKFWFSSMTTVTPVTRDHCRIDFIAAWNVFRRMPFIVPVFRWFGKKFLRQDQTTMEKQAIGLQGDSHMILIDDADRPAKWYFQLKAAHLESKRQGQAMEHPMTGPVTLRWRS